MPESARHKVKIANLNPRIAALQAKLAHGIARADIEIHCNEPVRGWYDTCAVSDPEIAPAIAEAVEYLKGIGMLTQHPVHSHWVWLVHDPKIADATNPLF